jgi:glycosyltransferase involved in cell wall biosynthesis
VKVKSIFLARSRNPKDELRVANFLELTQSLDIQVIQHYWDRELQPSNQESIHDLNRQASHVFAYEASYNKAFGSLLGQLRWQAFLFFHILRERPSIIYACDLDSAIIPMIYRGVSSKKNVTLFFDEFDRFSTRSDNFGRFSKKIFSMLEKIVYEISDYVIVASNERQLEDSNIVIQNFPSYESGTKSRDKDEIPKVSYVGLIQEDRGLKALIQAIEVKRNWNCSISGFGSNFEEMCQLGTSNVKFQGQLSQNATMEEFRKAWLTIATYDPSFQNNRFSASTKVMQSLLVSTPVIVSKGGSLEEIVTKHGLGWAVEYNNSVEIVAVLNERESWSEMELNTFRKNAENYIADLRDDQNANRTKLSKALISELNSL